MSNGPSTIGRPSLIELRDVDLSIRDNLIVQGLDLSIGSGEFVCVIGPSGCGKTTMLRLIAGLVAPTRGQVLYRGEAVQGPRQDVAVVFQDYGKALLPWATAAGNIELVLRTFRVPRIEWRERVDGLLARVGLKGRNGHYPGQLSGGQQQRLQIARCLAQEPKVLLMDEPFGALDAMTRHALQDEMQAIVSAEGTTVFFVTHDLEEAAYLGDRVIGLLPRPGRVGTVVEVNLERPRHQLTTRESPRFLELRHILFDFIRDAESA